MFNGNWKHRWRREFEDESDRRQFIIEQNKVDFGEALSALKAADPNWEAWYDDDANIPPYIRWLETQEVKRICQRMLERARQFRNENTTTIQG